MKLQQFNVSKKEINRRIRAYFSLALTWPAVVAAGSLLLPANARLIALALAAGILIALLIIGAATMRFLRSSHLHTTYEIEGKTFKRVIGRQITETIDLAAVQQISIKYISHGAIRQIALVESNGRRHNIDGAEDFEALRALLVKVCANVPVNTWREPINYDHALFYPALGCLLGGLSVLAVALLSSGGELANRAMLIGTVTFNLAVAAYLAAATPLRRQYGSPAKNDWFLALTVAIAAIAAGAAGWFF